MERRTTRAAFCQGVSALAETLADDIWTMVVETAGTDGVDTWLREHGGAWLRQVLGVALTARAEQLGVTGVCGGGETVAFRQRRPVRLHTVLPGREVDATLIDGQCAQCHAGLWPVLRELGADAEGFTPALQALATLAGVIEPYDAASTERLGRFAGGAVRAEKMQALGRRRGRAPVRRSARGPPPAWRRRAHPPRGRSMWRWMAG